MDPAEIDDSFKIKTRGTWRWQCNKCEKDYSTKYSLMTHLVCHTGVKPFVCTECGKAFRQLSHLNTHQLRHAGLRPHSCKVCGKSFVQSSHLKRHMNTHNSEGALYCDLCPRKFTYPSEVRAHKVKMHGTDRVKRGAVVYQPSHGDLNETINSSVIASHVTIDSNALVYTNGVPNGKLQTDNKDSLTLLKKINGALHVDQIMPSKERTDIEPQLVCQSDTQRVHPDQTHSLIKQEITDMDHQIDEQKLPTNPIYNALSVDIPQQMNQPDTSVSIKDNDISPQIDYQWPCNQCTKTFPTQFELITHMASSAHNDPIKLTSSNNMVVDDTCATMVGGVRRWQCRMCTKNYSTKYGLMTHMVDHMGTKPFQCKECGKGFKQLSHLNTHRLRHQGLRPHRCNICNKAFVQGSHLKRHMHTHTTDGAFFCDLCPRKFTYPSELRAHKEKAHTPSGSTSHKKLNTDVNGVAMIRDRKGPKLSGDSVIMCPECGKSFHYQSQMDKHMKRHQNIRPHICSECGMQFMEVHHLTQHAFTHTGLKPYHCPVCRRAFALEANMKRHLFIHSGVRDYECHLCRRRFAQKQTLHVHMITHSDRKPYICRFCGKSFRRNRNLLCHLQLHTNSKPYKCLSCGSRFNRKGNLKKHQKEVHDLDPRMDFAHLRALRVTDNTLVSSFLEKRDFHDALPDGQTVEDSPVTDQHGNTDHNNTSDERDDIVDYRLQSDTIEYPELEQNNINDTKLEDPPGIAVKNEPTSNTCMFSQLPLHQSPNGDELQSDLDSMEDIFNDAPIGVESDILNHDMNWEGKIPNIDNQIDGIQNRPKAMMPEYALKSIDTCISELINAKQQNEAVNENPSGVHPVVIPEHRMSRRKGLPRKLVNLNTDTLKNQ